MEGKRPRPGKILREFEPGGNMVRFRYLRKDDIEGAMRHINSLVNEKAYIGMQKSKTRKQEKEWLEQALEGMRKGKSLTVVVEVNGEFRGSAGVNRKPLDANSHVCTFGLGIHGDYRSMGIGTELMKLLIQQARDVLGCRVAEISVYEPNLAAKRLYEKMGFMETGRIPEGCHYFGKYYDEIILVRKLD